MVGRTTYSGNKNVYINVMRLVQALLDLPLHESLVYFSKSTFQNHNAVWFDLSASGVWTVSVYYIRSEKEYIVYNIVLGQHAYSKF